MSGIFPNTADGGLAPNATDTNNPSHAYDPNTEPLNTAALYYGNGCDVRLRPEVVNAIISELEGVVDIADRAYDHSKLNNLQVAARYLIQRGLPLHFHSYIIEALRKRRPAEVRRAVELDILSGDAVILPQLPLDSPEQLECLARSLPSLKSLPAELLQAATDMKPDLPGTPSRPRQRKRSLLRAG